MAKFDLGDFAKTLRNVPDSGTNDQEQITYLDEALLQGDEKNFYELSEIEGLAANIELIGLQQPIRVRPDPADVGAYLIVSGHRRMAAIRLLKKDNPERWARVPCIIEDRPEESDAMRELRLIYANSDTRKMSPADIGKQAERVESLLYELKEQGMDFPGRMRDHVAEACRVSRSKLARLKKISNNLAPCYKSLWDAGHLPEDTADALSSLPEDVQERIKRVCPKKLPSAYNIRRMHDKMERGKDYCAAAFACPDGSACTHLDKFFRHDLNCGGSWETCGGNECCVKCRRGGRHAPGDYSAACPDMCAKAKAIYEKTKADKKEADERKEKKSRREAIAKGMNVAQRIVRAADAAGLSDKSKIQNSYSGIIEIGRLRSVAQGNVPDSMSNYSLNEIIPYRSSQLAEMAKHLHCSTDYLLGLTDELRPAVPESGQQMMLAGWMPGGTNPAHSCECVVDFELGSSDKAIRRLAKWNNRSERWEFSSGNAIEAQPIKWIEIPADGGEK